MVIAGCSDQSFKTYETYEDAIEDNIIAKGWMPNYYPKSAKTIILVTNLDTNTFVIKSEIEKGDIGGFMRNCQPDTSKNDIRHFDDVEDPVQPLKFKRFYCNREHAFVELLNEKYVFYSNNF